MSDLSVMQRPSRTRRRGTERGPGLPGVEVESGPEGTAASPVRFRRPRKSSPALKVDAKPDRTPPPPVFHPLAYRSVVAAWSIESRERWGLRSNELEESGLAWRDAETQAFVEVWNQLRRAGGYADPDAIG